MILEDSFTEAEYAELLRIAAGKYRFVDLAEAETMGIGAETEQPIIIWRHDVDFSPHRALAMAKIEHALGIQCVYHFLLSGSYYNVLEPEVSRLVAHIGALGHHLGLHFDMDVFGVDSDPGEVQVVERAAFERNILEAVVNRPLTSFSFHNYTLNAQRLVSAPMIAGLPNFAGSPVLTSFRYVSDSSGLWRYDRLRDVLVEKSCSRLLVLTHPLWWPPEALTPLERVERCISGRAARNLAFYVRILARDGRLNTIAERSGLSSELIASVMGYDT